MIKIPNITTIFSSIEKKSQNYADVSWHIDLIENGYTKINTKAKNFYFGEKQYNWAYFPLMPLLAKLLNFFIQNPFWSLWGVCQALLLLVFTCFDIWVFTYVKGSFLQFAAWLVLLFFIIPPVGFFVNFIVPSAFFFGVSFYMVTKWIEKPEGNRLCFFICCLSCFLSGVSRFQEILFNFLIIVMVSVITIWFRRPFKKRQLFIFLSANISPLIIILLTCLYYANDAFAFQKVQSAWDRSLSLPWIPWAEYVKSGIMINLHYDDLFFTATRGIIFLFFIGSSLCTLIVKHQIIQDFITRKYSEAFIFCWFILISFLFLTLPSFSFFPYIFKDRRVYSLFL